MTKIAIMSDLHANIHAVELVLKDMERRNVDKIVCLGDLVTKYFYPAEVIDAVKSTASIVLKGNCDNLVASKDIYTFARGKMGLSRIEYLSELPVTEQLVVNKTLLNLYHSIPGSLDAMFNPLFSNNSHTKYRDKIVTDYSKMFTSSFPQVSVVGHTHQNYIGIEKQGDLYITRDPVTIGPSNRAIINVGSAGEHSVMAKKNGIYVPVIDPYLTYAIIDSKGLEEGIRVEIIHVPYRDELKRVYYDMIDLQEKKEAPHSPIDTGIVFDSLVNMGYKKYELKPKDI